MDTEKLLERLDLDDLIGQMLCFDLPSSLTEEEVENLVKKTKAGSFFVSMPGEGQIAHATKMMEKYTKLPGMIAADVECGPGHVMGAAKIPTLPAPMAWGACNDPELIEKAHIATGEWCREHGIHWSFSPIVDINYNPNNPVTNIRAISDKPEQVAKIAVAAIRGMQKNGMMAAGCKHFPGDGMDDRNQHFCTTINSMSKEDWMNTYGYVYKEMMKADVASVMVAHIALPAYDEKMNEWIGYPPASLSYNLQTKLLKEELGYQGCIVSDALSMIGASATVPYDRLSVEFVKAGGDMLLFPLPEYFDQLKAAVLSGEIPMERIRDAVRRIIELKKKARLFEDQEAVLKDVTHEYDVSVCAKEIAEKSLTLVRNYDNILPLNVKPGDLILLVNLYQSKDYEPTPYTVKLDTIREELEKRGFRVKECVNPSRKEIRDDMKEAAAVLVNCKISCQDYCGGTLRADWGHVSAFWRGEILRHPKFVFTSFGDPYKLYEYPYLKTYVNAYSNSISTQKAFVRAILGEIPFAGKNPVSLKDFFEIEV